MKDIEGKELKVGDVVICTTSAVNGWIGRYIITRFTPTTIKVKHLDSNGIVSGYEHGVTYPNHQVYKIEKNVDS